MAGYCTLVLYFHSPAAHENTATHLCNVQPYCLLTHQIFIVYRHCAVVLASLPVLSLTMVV